MSDQLPSDSPSLTESPSYPAEWSTWTKRVAAVLLLIAGVYSLTFLGPVLQVLIIALLLVLFFFIPIQFMMRWLRFPYWLAVISVFALYLGSITFAILRIGPAVADTISSWQPAIENVVNTGITFFRQYTPERDRYLYLLRDEANPENDLRIDLNFLLEPISQLVKGEASNINVASILGNVAGNVANVAGGVFGTLGNLILGHLLAFFILLEMPRAYRAFLRMDDVYEREYAILLRGVLRVWLYFFRGQVIIALIIGVATWLQFQVMGVPGAIFVGVTCGLLALIPTVGNLLSIIPVTVAPLIGGSTVFTELDRGTLVLLVALINILVTQTFTLNVLAPKITGDAVSLPLPVVIIGLFIGTAFGGILGALLIAPILGTLRLLVDYTLRKIRGGDPFPNEPRPELILDAMFSPRRRSRKPASALGSK
ncbi:MAG: AI-2E family transporter [Anaerolineae bacterium]|nr:AI-2E family transporter [Anaerolineae bacterium]